MYLFTYLLNITTKVASLNPVHMTRCTRCNIMW